MRRRDFIALVGGTAAAWPLVARAQQPAGRIWRLGILQPGAPPDPLVEAIRQRLRELGYIEGRNIVFEYRWAEGKLDRLTDLARELVGSKVDVITTLSTPAALVARNTTTTIPIVFTAVGDPVGSGVVPSLARPQKKAKQPAGQNEKAHAKREREAPRATARAKGSKPAGQEQAADSISQKAAEAAPTVVPSSRADQPLNDESGNENLIATAGTVWPVLPNNEGADASAASATGVDPGRSYQGKCGATGRPE
jgi:hypothetical protein